MDDPTVATSVALTEVKKQSIEKSQRMTTRGATTQPGSNVDATSVQQIATVWPLSRRAFLTVIRISGPVHFEITALKFAPALR